MPRRKLTEEGFAVGADAERVLLAAKVGQTRGELRRALGKRLTDSLFNRVLVVLEVRGFVALDRYSERIVHVERGVQQVAELTARARAGLLDLTAVMPLPGAERGLVPWGVLAARVGIEREPLIQTRVLDHIQTWKHRDAVLAEIVVRAAMATGRAEVELLRESANFALETDRLIAAVRDSESEFVYHIVRGGRDFILFSTELVKAGETEGGSRKAMVRVPARRLRSRPDRPTS